MLGFGPLSSSPISSLPAMQFIITGPRFIVDFGVSITEVVLMPVQVTFSVLWNATVSPVAAINE